MRRSLFTFAILSLLIAACASAAPSPTPGPVARVMLAPTTPPTTQEPTAEPVYAKLKDYVASDPSLVGTTGRPQFVEFFAFWCPTCQAMRPTVHELQDIYGSMVDFVYLDIDAPNTKALQQKLTFTGLRPTIIFLDANGQEKSRLVGEHTKEELADHIDDLIAVG